MQDMSIANNVKKILIADDEPDILEIISYNLQQEGYEIVTAKNGNEALDKAIKLKPDLIILDIMMPGKNGMEVCNILRMQPAFNETLIIFLTALSDEGSEIKGLESGADDYITKPVSTKVLVSKVNALFRRVIKDEKTMLQLGDLKIDREKFIVNYLGNDIILARKEFELLGLQASQVRFFYATKFYNRFGAPM